MYFTNWYFVSIIILRIENNLGEANEDIINKAK